MTVLFKKGAFSCRAQAGATRLDPGVANVAASASAATPKEQKAVMAARTVVKAFGEGVQASAPRPRHAAHCGERLWPVGAEAISNESTT